MNYLKLTSQYLSKNFFKLLPFALVPAVAMAFSGSFATAFKFFLNFEANVGSLWSVFSHFSVIGGRSWGLGILTLFCVILFCSMLYGGMERQMRVGKYSFKKALFNINETIMVVLPIYLIAFASFELGAFLVSVIIFLFKMAFGGAAIYLSVLIVLLAYIGIMIFLTQLVFVIPSALVVGYSLKDSILYSMRIVADKGKAVFFGLTLIILPAVIISTAVDLIFSIQAVNYIVDIILNLAIILFVNAFSMVAYFEATNEARRDIEDSKKNYLT